MAKRDKPPATYDELRQLPEHLIGELIAGDLIASPRPSSRHAWSATGINGLLFEPFHRAPGNPGNCGWWIVLEPELHLGKDVVVPDLAGWRRDRMATFPDVAFFEQAPDWVCEVTSPSTVRVDRGRKMAIYARASVGHLWLVDPVAMTLEVYRHGGEVNGSRWLVVDTFVGDDRVRAEPFDAIEIDLARLWLPQADSPPSAPSTPATP